MKAATRTSQSINRMYIDSPGARLAIQLSWEVTIPTGIRCWYLQRATHTLEGRFLDFVINNVTTTSTVL